MAATVAQSYYAVAITGGGMLVFEIIMVSLGAPRDTCRRSLQRCTMFLLLISPMALPSQLAGQWVEPPGQGWVSLSAFHQATGDVYDVDGDRGVFLADGHAVATASFLTVAWGLTTGIDAWTQASFQRLRFEDLTGEKTSVGPGDVRLFLRANPFLWMGSAIPVALRGGVKVPVGDFDVGSSVIPLGDGQRDWELMLEVGRSFYPVPVYVMGWAGYRWRESRDGGRVDFGNERFFYVAAGGTAKVVDFKVALDGWYGATPVFNGVLADGAERDMIRVSPSLLLDVGPGQLELGARVPLSGRNLPAGSDFVLGYFTRLRG